MRKIEQSIVSLLKNSDKGIYKVTCRDTVSIFDDHVQYALWDSVIFWTGSGSDDIFYFSGRGFQTQTTKNRLSSILLAFAGAFVKQVKKFNWFLIFDNKKYPINADDIFYIKGNRLYKLETAIYKEDQEILPL